METREGCQILEWIKGYRPEDTVTETVYKYLTFLKILPTRQIGILLQKYFVSPHPTVIDRVRPKDDTTNLYPDLHTHI